MGKCLDPWVAAGGSPTRGCFRGVRTTSPRSGAPVHGVAGGSGNLSVVGVGDFLDPNPPLFFLSGKQCEIIVFAGSTPQVILGSTPPNFCWFDAQFLLVQLTCCC